MSKRLLIMSFCVAAAVLASGGRVLACSCMAKPAVLDAFEASDLVITARLNSVEKSRFREGPYDIGDIRYATMIVDKVYKGNLKPGAALKFAQGGGSDCIWTYSEENVGDEFLFYLGKPTRGHPFFDDREGTAAEPMYYPVTCGRSQGLKYAWDDLAYLDNITKVRGKTRLSGTFGAWSGELDGANIKLKIISKTKTFAAKTNKDGFFEIYNLPAGDYVVQPEIPFGWKINSYMLGQTSTGFEDFDPDAKAKVLNNIPVRIREGRHSALDLIFDIDTAIKGRVLSPAGKPMKGVCVKAVSTELKEGDYRGHTDCTDEKGEFVIDEMAPGNYLLVVNDDGRVDADEPFGTIFYPGVLEFGNAGVISVEAGRYATGRTIQVPQTVELVTIAGKFVYSDGKPVADEWVKFEPDDAKRFDTMRLETDAEGNFAFRVPKGAAGKISGEMYTYTGEFKNCAKLEEQIAATGSKSYNAKSTVAEVDTLAPPVSVEIVLPFPYCAKAQQ